MIKVLDSKRKVFIAPKWVVDELNGREEIEKGIVCGRVEFHVDADGEHYIGKETFKSLPKKIGPPGSEAKPIKKWFTEKKYTHWELEENEI